MPKDPNKAINRAIKKKEKDIAGWAKFRSEALLAGEKKLAEEFLRRITKAQNEIMELQAKLK